MKLHTKGHIQHTSQTTEQFFRNRIIIEKLTIFKKTTFLHARQFPLSLFIPKVKSRSARKIVFTKVKCYLGFLFWETSLLLHQTIQLSLYGSLNTFCPIWDSTVREIQGPGGDPGTDLIQTLNITNPLCMLLFPCFFHWRQATLLGNWPLSVSFFGENIQWDKM